MISSIVSRLVILVFGTLYPAYASYKAVRAKNVKEYVKWMMYWIVFALFTCAETFTDVFLSFWFPFYYEIKVILVLWLLSPATKGSSILYRKFVHPMLTKREQEIDEYIARAKEQGYHTVLSLGTKGVNYATSVIMQTAIKGGGGLVNQLRRSYSLGDISSDVDMISDMNRGKQQHPDDQMDHTDAPVDARLLRSRGYTTRSSPSGGIVDMYFPEVDVDVRQRKPRSREPSIPLSQIRSNEDISSGYSSGEALYSGSHPRTEAVQEPLVRTSSVGSTRVTRTKTPKMSVGTTKRMQPTEDSVSSDESEDSESQNEEDQFFDVSTTTESVPIPFQKPASPPISPQIMGITNSLMQSSTTASKDQPSAQSVIFQSDQPPSSDPVTSSCVKNQFVSTVESENLAKDVLIDLSSPVTTAIDVPLSPSDLAPLTLTNGERWNNAVTSERKECDPQSSSDVSVDIDDANDVAPIRMPVVILPSIGSAKREITAMKLGSVNPVPSNQPDITDLKQGLSSESASFQVTQSDGNVAVVEESSNEIFYESPETIQTASEIEVDPVVLESDETEFADAENEVFEDSSSFALCNDDKSVTSSSCERMFIVNHDRLVSPESEVAVEKSELLDSGRLDRAGKYNKRPAPCPPKQTEVETVQDLERALNITAVILDSAEQQSSSPGNAVNVMKSEALVRESDLVPALSESSLTLENVDNTSPDIIKKDLTMPTGDDEMPCPSVPPRPSVKPAESENKKFEVLLPPSPVPSQKKTKSKQDSAISRLLSMPKNHLTSFFPFLSNDSHRGLVATSLTSLSGDLEEQLRGAMHGSLTNIPTASSSSGGGGTKPPALPPKKKSQGDKDEDVTTSEASGGNASQFRMREMSHSPPRRQTNL